MLVAVTGGAGFIGSHVVDRLVADGYSVIVLDDFSTGKRANLARHAGDNRVEVKAVDVADGLFAPLAEVTRRRGPVARIIHLAAQVSVVKSIESPLADARINYGATLAVLEYARHCGVKKVVLASSAAVYGDVTEMPVAESALCRPVSPYGIHKLSSEHALRYYSMVHGVEATALRFFNVFGPRQDPSSPYSGVISIFADRAMTGRGLTIFGDGQQTRDFVYVADVARAVVTAVMSDAADRAAVNIGTGSQTTVNQLASTVVELCGTGVPIEHAPARPGEILRSVAAVKRAEQLLGFRANTELAEGLRETLDWVRSSSSPG